jgi:hypothetical protein
VARVHPHSGTFTVDEEVDENVEVLIRLFGGVEAGGGGFGILPGRGPVLIDPHGWRTLSPAERRRCIGFAVKRCDRLEDPARRKALEEAGLGVIRAAIDEIERRGRADLAANAEDVLHAGNAERRFSAPRAPRTWSSRVDRRGLR